MIPQISSSWMLPLQCLQSVTAVCIIGLALLLFIVNRIYRSFKIKEDFGDLYVLITGCDTGFGYRTAIKLDKLGFHVFATCLTQEKVQELTETCSKNLVAFQMNVADEDTIRDGLTLVKKHLGGEKGLWALINNAGVVGAFGPCEWLKKSDYEATLNVNLLGMVSVTNAFLPLVRKCRGRVVNMSSTVGRAALLPAPYSVSKFCVEAYTDMLRREAEHWGVSVHTIEPGGYKTNITDPDLHSGSADKVFNSLDPEMKNLYGETYKKKLIDMVSLFSYTIVGRNLDEVVDTYIHAVSARFPKTRYVVGFNGNFVLRPLWTLPTCFVDLCMSPLYPKLKGS
ncbi:retinol dehydrogenase 7-like [Physella acuta]|uniref:retinol dehydrogenase 7-like n=1 Tax=Physella acuta TaxID=109671 RepID=UPI0027DB61F0|nr:retinol dehydrogenase 7-like [Physella acuta]XP_059148811.1 retinol dehydrogenase 7-like [Physella acuta]XP_059148813.1 retinol dehydrogenase 7-like [Physella acuta]